MVTAQDIEKIVAPVIEAEHMELVDVQIATESGKKVVRIFIDKEGGIKLADCELMSNKVGTILDESDILPESYILEMSSPGLDRILKKRTDFEKFIGERAKVTTAVAVNNQKNFKGKILAVTDEELTIDDVTNRTVKIPLYTIVKARLDPEI